MLLCITGSVAAVMAVPGIVWLRQRQGVREIRVVMTRPAAHLIPAHTVSAVSGSATLVDWDDALRTHQSHVSLAGWADVLIIMPATANTLSKLATGQADDLVSACALAAACPVVVAPAMNHVMWDKPATRRNVRQLVDDGFHIVQPIEGFAVADGETWPGSMAQVETVWECAATLLDGYRNTHRADDAPTGERR
ncbi:flavoprotein [Streptomyces sp. NPDC088789]|uniref:flavoprotein n=1 Tax=Streptomyces sp. NPDC088789 TaxID=3365899 RepID=UPI003805EED3